jgi:hypothetical protein
VLRHAHLFSRYEGGKIGEIGTIWNLKMWDDLGPSLLIFPGPEVEEPLGIEIVVSALDL